VASGSFHFDRFALDADNRRLTRDGVAVDLNARYFDALLLLVRDVDRLVSKDRFHDEVWRGVPITDEALTQCIKTLRRQLGDDATRPRFIETVPKHGYRFVAPVAWVEAGGEGYALVETASPGNYSVRDFLLLGGAGTIGAGVAGVIGGLFYGFAAAAQPLAPGGASALFVLLWLTIAVALIGGAGVSFGIAAMGFARPPYWRVVGGALGGMAVGGVVKLVGLDAFTLLLGRSPGGITGASEGLLLGAAVGIGAWLGGRRGRSASLRRAIAVAGLAGATGGVLILLLGGRLMAGSLDQITRAFPGSRLSLDHLGMAVGERGFGPLAHLLTGALEGALFGSCIVGALMLARRRLKSDARHS